MNKKEIITLGIVLLGSFWLNNNELSANINFPKTNNYRRGLTQILKEFKEDHKYSLLINKLFRENTILV